LHQKSEQYLQKINTYFDNFIKTCPGVLTIYMGKPEIPVGKSNGSPHSIWDASENMSCDLR